MSRQNFFRVSGLVFAVAFISTCGKKNDNNGCTGCGGGSALAITPTVDLTDSKGLLVVDNSASATKLLLTEHNRRVEEMGLVGAPVFNVNAFDASFAAASTDSSSTAGDTSLQKVDANGKPTSALKSNQTDTTSNGPGPQPQKLPKIQTIAVSPTKEVYLHFEQAFMHRIQEGTAFQSGDPRSSGNMCQIFRVKGGTLTDLTKTAPTGENLECLDYEHFIDTWRTGRSSVFQFDSDGNVYYPGSLPNGGGKMVVYKFNRATSVKTEMINSNICVQDYLVTKKGGIFYTGTSSCSGGGSSAGGFFRYIAPTTGSVTEIARDWWNFIYETVQTATVDKAIYFGPDPTSATTASWNSACLFNFDPSGTTAAARSSNVITCGADIWGWIQMSRAEDLLAYPSDSSDWGRDHTAGWITEFGSRCTSSGQVFAGGGSQISSIKQDSTGTVYVIGNVRKKKAGSMQCRVEIHGPHCTIAGIPNLTYAPTGHANYASQKTACIAASGTWVDKGTCSSGSSADSDACTQASFTWQPDSGLNYSQSDTNQTLCSTTGSVASTSWYGAWSTANGMQITAATGPVPKFRIGDFQCKAPTTGNSGGGDGWTDEYKGLAKVNASTKTLSLLSTTSEQAINLWLVNDVAYYSSFDSTQGKYYLKTSTGTELASNFEVYNLSDSPVTGSLFYDGLNFANNTYTFGTILTASPYTRAETTGLTGTLKTIVIYPK